MRKLQEEEFNKLRIIKNDLDENIPFQDNAIIINSHDEEMEETSSIDSKFKEMFFNGSDVDSQSNETIIRNQDLMIRKAQVINQLNEICNKKYLKTVYAKDQSDDNYEESDDSALYYQEQKGNLDTR